MRHLFTSESVTEGHPDKMADQISDSVLDAVLKDDPKGRVACEVLITTGICVVSGEITTNTYVDVPRLVRSVINDIGYSDANFGFDSKTCGIINSIQSQSPDIAMGVDTGGAGDQGLMFGFACDETPELMPIADHDGSQAGSPVERSPARRQARFPAAGRQEPGQRGIREWQAQAHRGRGSLHSARRQDFDRRAARPRSRSTSSMPWSPPTWWIPPRNSTSIPLAGS